jgi:hypothetical protein
MEKSWEWHGTVVGYYSPNIHEAKMPSVPLKWEKMAIKSWMEWGTPEIVGWNLSPDLLCIPVTKSWVKSGDMPAKMGELT